jgi:hypothetical protein
MPSPVLIPISRKKIPRRSLHGYVVRKYVDKKQGADGGGGWYPLHPPTLFYVQYSRLLVRYLKTTLHIILLIGCFLHDNQHKPLVEKFN